MKNHTRVLGILIFTALVFFGNGFVAHAGTYSFFSGPVGDGTSGSELLDYMPSTYVNAIASDIFYNSYLYSGGSPACTYNAPPGNCGYSSHNSGTNGSAWVGRTDYNNPPSTDDHNFIDGYPGQFPSWEGNSLQQTGDRICQIINTVLGGASQQSFVTSTPVGSNSSDYNSGNGDDGGDRNTAIFTGTGWDLFEADKTYGGLLGGHTARPWMKTLSCNSSASPAPTLTINGSNTASVVADQPATLVWDDGDIYGAAGQTCTASVSPTGSTAFTIPVPAASNFPEPGCTDVELTKTGDPGQTSTLKSVPTDGNGHPLYVYECDDQLRQGSAPAVGCTTIYSECDETDDSGCVAYENHYQCEVAPPGGTMQVQAHTPATYTYSYNCKSAGGTTNMSVTLVVGSGAAIDLTASGLTPSGTISAGVTPLSATVSNISSTPTGIGFTNVFAVSTHADHSSPTYYSAPTGALDKSPATEPMTYNNFNFVAGTTYYIEACADTDTSGTIGGGGVTDGNVSNNCTPWNTITVTNQGTVSCTPSPSTFTDGTATGLIYTANPSNLGNGNYTWTPQGTLATYFPATGHNSTLSGTITLPADAPTGQYGMQIGATGAWNSSICYIIVGGADCQKQPAATIIAALPRVVAGTADKITWSAVGIPATATCTITGPNLNVPDQQSDGSCDVKGDSGSAQPKIDTQSTYVIDCNSTPEAKASVTVDVIPAVQEF